MKHSFAACGIASYPDIAFKLGSVCRLAAAVNLMLTDSC